MSNKRKINTTKNSSYSVKPVVVKDYVGEFSDYYNNRFKLTGLDLWPELNGMYYSDLPNKIKSGLDRRSISSIVLLKESAPDEEDAILTVSHQIEIPVGLRFNLFRVTSGCKFYLGCNADFGYNISEGQYFSVNKQTFSIEPQIGFAGRSYDFGIYYKKYLDDKLLFKYTNDYDQRIGCFLTWYF